ncbi:IS630 transposase-related protein [uncultured Psychrobacter sp.]|uniref:IS630 transposase-related protein n=1 Tax=uncultured Psychrobacter sp. TaxID=259303 RepID=UPI00345750F0
MTYSLDFRRQVLKSLNNGMTYAQAAAFYNLSPTTIQKWKKNIHNKATRKTKLPKLTDAALLQDIESYPNSYHYERAKRLDCSASGVCLAMKRLGIKQKKSKNLYK